MEGIGSAFIRDKRSFDMTWDNAIYADAGATILKATAGTHVRQSKRQRASEMAFFAANVLDKRTHFLTIADKSTDARLCRGNEMKPCRRFLAQLGV